METIVIALGGNALLNAGDKPEFALQSLNAKSAIEHIASIIDSDARIVITHGNGPQVGDELERNERSRNYIPKLPLHVLVAETQALIGTMLSQEIISVFDSKATKKRVSTILTHVIVDQNDPQLTNPTKPIGPSYSKHDLQKELHFRHFEYVSENNGYRRVVPSPRPVKIVELDAIKELINKNNVVIACGGGGIPVAKVGNGFKGIDGIIDKDLTSALLAIQINATKLIILTNIDYVHMPNKNSSIIKQISAAKLKSIINTFEEGTMKPKLEACLEFANTGHKSYIGNLKKSNQILSSRSGTTIVP